MLRRDVGNATDVAKLATSKYQYPRAGMKGSRSIAMLGVSVSTLNGPYGTSTVVAVERESCRVDLAWVDDYAHSTLSLSYFVSPYFLARILLPRGLLCRPINATYFCC